MTITTFWTCDRCGREIHGPYYARISVTGLGVDLETGEDVALDETHHFHAGGENSCYRGVIEALWLSEDAGPSLESIPTISAQAVAARRRKHAKQEED